MQTEGKPYESKSGTRQVRGEQGADHDHAHPHGKTDPQRPVKGSEDLGFRDDRAMAAQPGRRRDLCGSGIIPTTHGGTLALLIAQAERERKEIREEIASHKGRVAALEERLKSRGDDIEQLKALLSNWQRNVERVAATSDRYPQGDE